MAIFKYCIFKSFIMALGVSLVMVSSGKSSGPALGDDDHNYEAYIGRFTAWAQACSSILGDQSYPNQVEFEVLPADEANPHQTKVKAKRYYQVGQTKHYVSEKELTFPHVSAHRIVPNGQYCIDDFGILYLPQAQLSEYERPAIPALGLAALRYTRNETVVAGQDVNVCAFSVTSAGVPVPNPPSGYYHNNGEDQLESPYLYSNGQKMVLTRVMEAECSLINTPGIYKFSYVAPAGLEIAMKAGTRLRVTQGQVGEESPLASALEQGLYKKRPEGGMIKLNSDFQPIEEGKVYSLHHPEGQCIQEIKVSGQGESNTVIIKVLEKTAFGFDIQGLNFNGRVFTLQEQNILGPFLSLMTHIKILNLGKGNNTVNYNALVPSLKRLVQLQQLDITNCGITADNKRQLQRTGLQIVDRTPPPPTPTPVPMPVVAQQKPPAPQPTVIATRKEEYDGGVEAEYFCPEIFKHGCRIFQIKYTRWVNVWSNGNTTPEKWSKERILLESKEEKDFFTATSKVSSSLKYRPPPQGYTQ